MQCGCPVGKRIEDFAEERGRSALSLLFHLSQVKGAISVCKCKSVLVLLADFWLRMMLLRKAMESDIVTDVEVARASVIALQCTQVTGCRPTAKLQQQKVCLPVAIASVVALQCI